MFRIHRFPLATSLAVVIVSALAGPVSGETPGALTVTERTELLDLLTASRAETEELAAQAQGEAWSAKPAPDRWSVGEVVEHLARSEEVLFEQVEAALDTEARADWESASAAGIDPLVANVRDRTQKFQAPEILQPTAEKSRDEVLAWYASGRTLALDYVRSTDDPLKAHFAEGPPGDLSAQQWLALLGSHNQRHNAQIREVLEWLASGEPSMEEGVDSP